ncbi:MAG: branched-chain amino acid ABC transporter permease [Paracoccaceae bacterium]
MPDQLLYSMEAALNGLLSGVMYALVALGFVLIYKASGIFNYAQGVMALFAALTLVGIMDGQVPFSHLINAVFGTDVHDFGWHLPAFVGIVLTIAVMIAFAWVVQQVIFRHLVGQEPIASSWRPSAWHTSWKASATSCGQAISKPLDVRPAQGHNSSIDEITYNLFDYGFYIDNLNIVATVVAVVLVAGLVMFSQYTKQGRAMRAVAGDHQAALSVGINLNFIWVLVWSLAGFVALVAGVMWARAPGVQFSLS